MEPRIQYCTAPDGVHLAFSSAGTGTPVVYVASPSAWGTMQVQLQVPSTRAETDGLVPEHTVVRYDCRGAGLSDRDVADLSFESHVRDGLAVIERVTAGPVALVAGVFGGPIGIAIASQYPERVSHLILARTAADMPKVFARSARLQALDFIAGIDWELYSEVVARSVVGWDHVAASRLAAQLRAENTPVTIARWYGEARTWDATEMLSGISAPTLVIHHTISPVFGDEHWARGLTAAIRGAQLIKVPPGEETARAINEFISGKAPEPKPKERGPAGTATILFADIVDSTALTEQLGDAAFRARSSRLDSALRAGIRECGGRPIEGKVMGDGVMAVFSAAREAIEGALGCRASAEGMGLALHLGIHAGDVTSEQDNVYGGAVNIASRICGLCEPGEILVSATIRELARTSAGVTFEDRGEQALKGIDDPVRVFSVRQASNI